MGRACEIRSVFTVLVGKYEGKKPRGRFKRRLEDKIKMDLKESELLNGFIWLRRGAGGRLS